MYPENDCTYKKKYSIVHAKKDISLRYQFFSLRQKNQQIFSADFNDAGKGTWTLMTAIVTRTWTVRVCQFRHSCISNCFAAPQLTKHMIQQRHLNVNTFFQMHIFYIFSKNCWHYALLLVSFLLVGNNNNDTCGSVGTGRRARLRILWLLQSCGFKSHLPHQKTSTFGWGLFCGRRHEPKVHISASLRSAQIRDPPDLVRPIFRIT